MEERNYRNWEKEEIKVLIQQIRENEMLRDAFRKAAELLDRSEQACKKKWYKDLKPYGDYLRNEISVQPVKPVPCSSVPVLGSVIKIIGKLKLKINETFKRTDSED